MYLPDSRAIPTALVRSLADVFSDQSWMVEHYATYVLLLETALQQVEDTLKIVNPLFAGRLVKSGDKELIKQQKRLAKAIMVSRGLTETETETIGKRPPSPDLRYKLTRTDVGSIRNWKKTRHSKVTRGLQYLSASPSSGCSNIRFSSRVCCTSELHSPFQVPEHAHRAEPRCYCHFEYPHTSTDPSTRDYDATQKVSVSVGQCGFNDSATYHD